MPTSRSQENQPQEVENADFKRSEMPTSRSQEIGLQEVGISVPNYNNINYNNQNYINHINHIEQSDRMGNDGMIDVMEDTSVYMAVIRENLEYDHHMKYDQYKDRELFEEIYETICDIVCVKRKMIRINGEDYPYELVKSRFLKLNSSHVGYVMDCMRDTASKITNMRSYLLTALYNASSTMNHYYQQEVQHDMYGGGWGEKGIV